MELQETVARSDEFNKITKTKHACIVEGHESKKKRLELSLPEEHEDHIPGKGYNSLSHCNLVRKFVPMPQEMKIPDAKAAVDKEWKKLETIPAWQLDKVKNKKGGYSGSTKTQNESPLCYNDGHLSSEKNAE